MLNNDNMKLYKYFGEYISDKEDLPFIEQKILEIAEEYFENVPDYFFTVPASSSGKYHPKCDLGFEGLIRHTKMCCEVAQELFRLEDYKNMHKFDIIIALICHDTYKSGYNDFGRTVSAHSVIAAEEFYNTFIQHKYDSNELIDGLTNYRPILGERISDICGMIASHMGQWGRIWPRTKQEKLVHLCDYLASRKCFEKFGD